MIKLYDCDTDAEIGTITESQLDFLQEQLVEETIDTSSYNLTEANIESLEVNGADPEVVELLRKAISGRSSMELRYEFD